MPLYAPFLVSLSVHEDVSDISVKERELSSGLSTLHEAVGEVSAD